MPDPARESRTDALAWAREKRESGDQFEMVVAGLIGRGWTEKESRRIAVDALSCQPAPQSPKGSDDVTAAPGGKAPTINYATREPARFKKDGIRGIWPDMSASNRGVMLLGGVLMLVGFGSAFFLHRPIEPADGQACCCCMGFPVGLFFVIAGFIGSRREDF